MYRVCPNPECPDLRITGTAAEFEYRVSACSACGTQLVDAASVPTPADSKLGVPTAPSLDLLMSFARSTAYIGQAEALDMVYVARSESIPNRLFYALLPPVGLGARDALATPPGGNEIILFVYHYSHSQYEDGFAIEGETVAAFRRSDRFIPLFSLVPDGLVDDVTALLGLQNIDFASDPSFSKLYFLRGRDEEATRSLFDQGLRSLLVREPGWSVSGAGQWVVVRRSTVIVPGADLPSFLAATSRIADAFPRRRGATVIGDAIMPDDFYGCPECGDGIAVGTTVCLGCSATFDADDISDDVCPACLASVDPAARECPSCGLTLQ